MKSKKNKKGKKSNENTPIIPVITAGMSTTQVISLLGQPTNRTRSMRSRYKIVFGFGSPPVHDDEYWRFVHSAGEYQFVVRDGHAVRGHSQPVRG